MKTLSAEHRKKMSEAHKGLRHSQATRKKISALQKGKCLSAEHKEKIRAALKGRTPANFQECLKKAHAAPYKEGAAHQHWKGNAVGYTALHQWVRRILGAPSLCANCGTTAARRYEWANISGTYKRDVTDWYRLCVSCHRKEGSRRGEYVPWNKGIKTGLVPKTAFKKGHDLWKRRLIPLLFLVVLFASPSFLFAAWTSDGTNAQRVDLSSHTAFDLPDGDWTLGGWIRVDANVGSSVGSFLRTSGAGDSTNPALHLTCRQASNSTPNAIHVSALNDSDTTDIGNYTSDTPNATPCSSTTPFHFLLMRSSGNLLMYINGAESTWVLAATGLNALTFAGGHSLLSTDANLFKFDGALCDWAKWNRALTAAERTGLAKGYSAKFFLAGQTWHTPMIRDYHEVRVAIPVTNQGSTVSACPRLYYPF